MSSPNVITPEKLARLIGRPDCPSLIDVCTEEDFACDPRLVPGAVRRSHRDVAEWAPEFAAGRSAVVICRCGINQAAVYQDGPDAVYALFTHAVHCVGGVS